MLLKLVSAGLSKVGTGVCHGDIFQYYDVETISSYAEIFMLK